MATILYYADATERSQHISDRAALGESVVADDFVDIGGNPTDGTSGRLTFDVIIPTDHTQENRDVAIEDVDGSGPHGIELRALIEIFNKRDNYLVNRIEELQAALDAVKASTGPADNIRDAVPAIWLATNTRPRSDAVQDYKDEVAAGNVDT